MKKEFFDEIIKRMEDTNIYFISVGLGWPRTDELAEKYPDRFIQTEASEQTALDIAVGLCYENKIPVVYTITPFLYRGFETLRTYIDHEKLPAKLVGAGRDDDYSKDDGFSHDASDIKKILGTLENIVQLYPETKEEIPLLMQDFLYNKKPMFLSLRR